jgi:hypothetical protein
MLLGMNEHRQLLLAGHARNLRGRAMKFSDKSRVFTLFAVCVLTVLAALTLTSRDPREQTIVLERFAQKLERAQRVDLATERYVRQLVVSVQKSQQADNELHRRQLTAISRIETVLAHQDGAVGALGGAEAALANW